ncbi:MAG: Na/Pi cotransporter family protein [Bacteriovoracaceae bacterium]
METFTIIYTLLGGLGLFFYGMKFISDGLQAVSGDVIRKMINSLTANRFMAVAVGLLVTCLVQSSSVTTVMTVGFVNASLMNLTQAIAVILGANIGTTITGWLISLNLGQFALLLVGLGFFPGLFSKTERWQHLGMSILGVGLLFMGLNAMASAFLPLKASAAFMDSITYFTKDHAGAYISSVMMGCLLTMIVQSSTAMVAITMVMAFVGILPFHTSICMVLGENIGTTISALLASIGATSNARRAASAHAIIKVVNVCIVLMIFPLYLKAVDAVIPMDPNEMNELGFFPYVMTHIAWAHTLFNVIAAVIFLPFTNVLAKAVCNIVPERHEKEVPHLLVLGDPQNMLPAASMTQAESELRKMKEIVERMYKLNREFWEEAEFDTKRLAKIIDYERITDNIHKEITVFLCYVMEKPMSHHQSEQLQSMIKIADEMESVADYIERLANYRERFKKDEKLTGDSRAEFFQFLDEVWNFFALVTSGLSDGEALDMTKIENKSHELQLWADSMREKHLDRISKGTYPAVTALTYSDMVVALRKIRAHSFLMAGAIENFHSKHE